MADIKNIFIGYFPKDYSFAHPYFKEGRNFNLSLSKKLWTLKWNAALLKVTEK